MSQGPRSFLLAGLLALLGAAVLHLLLLLGMGGVWPALVHLMIFGWISAMICAVNYHMMPVFAARDFPNARLIQAHWALFSAGVALATAGLLAGWGVGTIAGLLLQVGAALLFAANTVLLFLRGPRRTHRPPPPPVPDQPLVDRAGTQATGSAGMCLPLALLLLLAAQLGWIGGTWVLAAEHLAVLGWVMLMIVGVGYHVLPRFSGRGVRGLAWARAQVRCHIAALALIVVALGFGWPPLFAAGGLLMACAIGLFAWTVWPTLQAIRPRHAPIQVTFKERQR